MKGFQIAFACFALPQVILGDLAGDLQANGLTTLLDFVVKAGLADALGGAEPLTLFAPTNEAFANLPPATVNALTSDPELLKNVLLYHVIPKSAIPSSALKADNKVATATGTTLRVNVYNKYYPVVTVNGVRVVKPDVQAGQGSIVHVVDEVVPYLTEADTIPGKIINDPQFSTLLAAVKAAGLVDALSNPDAAFTVFAPTNDAFAKIPSATLNSILADKATLTSILLRHVVPEAIFSKGICWKTYKTLNENESLSTQLYKRGLVVAKNSQGYGRVVEADIVATNGVIHAIDTVI